MKTILRWVATAAVMMSMATNAHAWRRNWSQVIANESGLTYNQNYTLDMGPLNLKTVGAQAVYSTVTFATDSFNDGHFSTGTITVVSTSSLVGVKGSDVITVKSNTLPANAQILINGYQLNNMGDWGVGNVSSNTAVNIASAFNNLTSALGVTASTTSAGVVTVQCASIGSYCNAYTLSVNTSSITVATTKFAGGQDNAKICINGSCLVQGTDWISSATVTATAASIASATINASSLAGIVTSTNVAGVVYSTSTGVGLLANYSVWASTPALTCGPSYKVGANSSIVTTSSSLFIPAHGYTTALPVRYDKVTGTSPGQLVTGTTYYVVPLDANNLKLASTSANAQAGTPVVSISTQTTTGGGSFTLTPMTFAGTPALQWYASNDGTNYNAVSTSSVTWSSPTSTPTSTIWDFGNVSYRYLQMQVAGPTAGGMKLKITINGQTQ